MPDKTVVAIAVADEASANLKIFTKRVLREMYGSTEIDKLGFRESWAFIGVKNDPT